MSENTTKKEEITMSIERQAARFMCDVADAVASVKSGKTVYGEFYVSEVKIGFEGDDTDYRVIPNEHGDYDIAEVKVQP